LQLATTAQTVERVITGHMQSVHDPQANDDHVPSRHLRSASRGRATG